MRLRKACFEKCHIISIKYMFLIFSLNRQQIEENWRLSKMWHTGSTKSIQFYKYNRIKSNIFPHFESRSQLNEQNFSSFLESVKENPIKKFSEHKKLKMIFIFNFSKELLNIRWDNKLYTKCNFWRVEK